MFAAAISAALLATSTAFAIPKDTVGIPMNTEVKSGSAPPANMPPTYSADYWLHYADKNGAVAGDGHVYVDTHRMKSRDEFSIKIGSETYPKIQLEDFTTGEVKVMEAGEGGQVVCETTTAGFDVLANSFWIGHYWVTDKYVCDTYISLEEGGIDEGGVTYIYYQDAFNGAPRAMVETKADDTQVTIIFSNQHTESLDSAMFEVPSMMQCPAQQTTSQTSVKTIPFSHRIFH